MISNINTTKQLISKYNIIIKKGYGQNFLIDDNILNKIISASGVDEQTGVIEIGPGLGALTERLLEKSKKVLAYEIDKQMVEVLNNNFKNHKNIKIVNVDFLKVNLEQEIQYFADCSKVIVVSNLPYYITTPILFKLLENNIGIDEYYIMVQKEVAERFTGKPKTKDYNALSVVIEYKSESNILFTVGKNCFYPAPSVESSVIHIKRIKNDYGLKEEGRFLKFVQVMFNQRRKTLVNNLHSFYGISKEKLLDILVANDYDVNLRSEELYLKEIIQIYKLLFE